MPECGKGISLIQLREHTAKCQMNYSSDDMRRILIPDTDSEAESDTATCLPPRPFYQQLSLEDYCPQRVEQNSSRGYVVSPLAKYIQELMETVSNGEFNLRIRRSHVLEDALFALAKRTFSPYKTLVVKFIGEEAVDEGGPKKEFWRLLGEAIRKEMCAGDNEKLCLEHDVIGLQENKFKNVGILMAMSLAQQGNGFPFFGSSTFLYLCGKDISTIEVPVDEVPDHKTRTLIKQLMETNDSKMIQGIVSDNLNKITDSGYSRQLGKIGSGERHELIHTISIHGTIYKVIAELEQLKAGLNVLGVADKMKECPKMFEDYFTFNKSQNLTAEMVQELFEPVKYSEDSPESQAETYQHITRLLMECEDNPSNIDLRLSDVLTFFSGADKIPPMGFVHRPTLEFNSTSCYPTASTCTLTLTLPTKFKEYNDFKDSAIMAFKFHGGFGLL